MTQHFSKQQITQSLQLNLESSLAVQAAWLGGSTATGYEDDLSDTDIVIICEDPAIAFAEVERSLAALGTITQTWSVEESPWKHFSQKFYIFSEGPETYYVDVGVFNSLDPADYAEHFNVRRHGAPVILFDKMGILKKASESPRLEGSKSTNWENWMARFEVLYRTFLKESLRGKYIDSFHFYQRLVMMWVQLQRQIYTPQRHDFGLRYIYQDFSKEDAELIEKYLQGVSLEALREQAWDIRQRVQKIREPQGT